MNVAVLGASAKPERYSHQAVVRLMEQGHRVFPIHPALDDVLGNRVYTSLTDVPVPLDTVTVYVSASRSTPLRTDFMAAAPRRVIFNPGAENPELASALRDAGIETMEACTLVLLRTGQFENDE